MSESVVHQLASSAPVRGFLESHGLLGNPHVNPFDAARLRSEDSARWEATRLAGEHDRPTYRRFLGGLGSLAGIKGTPATAAAADTTSGLLSKLAPYGVASFPETWDKLHGSRGSVASLAASIQDTHPDQAPATTADTAGTIFKRIHGKGGPGAAGLSTRHLGELYKDLHARGLLGGKTGLTAERSADRLGSTAGALRAVQDLQVDEQMRKAGRFKEAISTGLIARVLESQQAAGALTPARARAFEGKFNKWLGVSGPSPGARTSAFRRNVSGINNSGLGRLPDASYQKLRRDSPLETHPSLGVPVRQELKPELASRAHAVYGGPAPAGVGRTDMPELSSALRRGNNGVSTVLSTPDVGVLGHELGHVATNARLDQYRATRRGGLLRRLTGGFDPMGTSRETLLSERLANAKFRRAVDKDLGGALGVGALDPAKARAFTGRQIEGYRLLDLEEAAKARMAAARKGGKPVLPAKVLKGHDFTTRKIYKTLDNPQKKASLRRLVPAAAGLGLAGLGVLGLGSLLAGRGKPAAGGGPQPPVTMPRAFDPAGNFRGFRVIPAEAKEKLFQTRDFVNHPGGFYDEPPKRPPILDRV